MKILILGASGLIGNGITSVLIKDQSKTLIGTYSSNKYFNKLNDSRFHRIDILKDDSIYEFIDKIKPDCIINCIGVTKHLNQLYSEENIFRINSYFPLEVSNYCSEHKVNFIHISTDCVFDGKHGNYTETDKPNANDIYGYSKSLSEKVCNRHLVLRTSTVGREINTKYGLLEWFLSLDNECEGYKNAFFSGITTIEFGKIILNYFLKNKEIKGLYNISSSKINKHDLLLIFSNIFEKKIRIKKNLSYRVDRSLNGEKFWSKFNYEPKSWESMLRELDSI